LANVANEEPRNTIFLLLPIEAGIFFSSAVFHSITAIRNNNGLRMPAENQPRPAKSLKFLLSTQFFLQNRSFAPETSLVSGAKRKISRQIRRSRTFPHHFFHFSLDKYVCIMAHIIHETYPIRVSFRCHALDPESSGRLLARRSWLAQLATQSLRSQELPRLFVRRTACQLRPVRPPERTPFCCLCSRRTCAGGAPLFRQRACSAGTALP